MSEDKKQLISNINQNNNKNQSKEKVRISENLAEAQNNEKLINEFNEYFQNNNINKENLFSSFNNDNNNLNINKEFTNNQVNQFPFFLDKEQFYQSFVLFQKYIYWNMQKNYLQRINQEQTNNDIIKENLNNNNNVIKDNQNNNNQNNNHNTIKEKNNNINSIDNNNNNNIKENKNNITNPVNENINVINNKSNEEELNNKINDINIKSKSAEIKEQPYNNSANKLFDKENEIINKEAKFNNAFYESKYSSNTKKTKYDNYDEKPIKSTHKTFLELLEKSLRNKNLEIFEKIYKGKIKLKNKSSIKKTNSFYSIEYNLNNDIKIIQKNNSFDNMIKRNYMYKNRKIKENNIKIKTEENKINEQDVANSIIEKEEINNNQNNIEKISKNDGILGLNKEDEKEMDLEDKKVMINNNNNISPKQNNKKENEINFGVKENSDKKNYFTPSPKNNNSKISSSHKEQIIQQKINELNVEIINFKEERNKINKLKEEYEKLQNKLIEDIQQFNDKKEEFEIYRQNEINKIKQDKKKYIAEHRNINDIKLNYRNMVISSKKDKEIIKNLKSQISDLKNLIKSKPNIFENKINRNSTNKINMSIINQKNNKKKNNLQSSTNNSNNNILINNNNIIITTNNNSEIDEENEYNQIDYLNNNRCRIKNDKQNIKSEKEEDFCTISDDLKEKERKISSVSNSKILKNQEKKDKYNFQRINSKFKNKHQELFGNIQNLKFTRSTQSQSNSKHKNKINKNRKFNNVEHVKTENNFITVNINTNTFGNGGFFLKKNNTLNNSNNYRLKNSNKKIINSKHSTHKEISTNINNNSMNNRKNKFLNQKNKEKDKNNKLKLKTNNVTKNNTNNNSNTNSLYNNRRYIQKSVMTEGSKSIINRNTYYKNKLKNSFKNKNKQINNINENNQNNTNSNNIIQKQSINRASFKKYNLTEDNREKASHKNIHPSILDKKNSKDINSCLTNSQSNKNKIFEQTTSSIPIKNKINNGINKINNNTEKNFLIKEIYSDNYDFSIPEKYTNSEHKLIKTINSNGKIINFYSKKKKEIIFQSGVRKEIFEDGFQIVNFVNGDKKLNYPDGKMVYYFNEAKTVQTTFSNGIQIFKFSNGQIEKHFPDKTKQICFPDGTQRFIQIDGKEETYYPNGIIQKQNTKKDVSLKNED